MAKPRNGSSDRASSPSLGGSEQDDSISACRLSTTTANESPIFML
jgi:hypothetical protein